MIPDNSEELRVRAGEYVLGVLDAHETNEVAAALAINSELRRAVAFWEEQLHPLSSLAISAEPPPGVWQAIEVRIRTNAAKPLAHSFWTNLAGGRPQDLPPLPRRLLFGSLLRPCQGRALSPSFTPRSRIRQAG
jgi:anti-sigma-K factor RskA